jgi:hypothetical protein
LRGLLKGWDAKHGQLQTKAMACIAVLQTMKEERMEATSLVRAFKPVHQTTSTHLLNRLWNSTQRLT